MILSVLIPTTPDREKMLYDLLYHLHHQIEKEEYQHVIELIVEVDNREHSVGHKRQSLLEKAKGEYVVFIDDDDEVSGDYISSIMDVINEERPDVIGFDGYMSVNGEGRENFNISKDLPYITIEDPFGSKLHLRYNNHLSPVKREIALQIGFKDLKFAEDFDYAKRLHESGLLKTETVIKKDLYHYKYIPNKTK